MPRIAAFLGVFLALGWLCPPAPGQLAGDPPAGDLQGAPGFADLLFQQVPDRLNGATSDTAWIRNTTGQTTSSLTADNFVLDVDASICGIAYYGFYGANDPEPPPYIVDPPATETMRVRFYSDVAGLPGGGLWERTFDDAWRERTGRDIAVAPGRDEFRYAKGFADCFQAAGGVQYWLEISQIGDPESRWRWESAHSDNTLAQQFPIGTNWRLFTSYGLAFELYRTPEPSSAVLIFLAGLARRRPPARRARR